MEKYSLERAQNEAFEIQKRAKEERAIENSSDILSKEDYTNNEISFIKTKIIEELSGNGYLYDSLRDIKFHQELLSDQDVQNAVNQRLLKSLNFSGAIKEINNIVKEFNPTQEFIDSPEFREKLLSVLQKDLSDTTSSLNIYSLNCAINFRFPSEMILIDKVQHNIAGFIKTELSFRRNENVLRVVEAINRLAPSTENVRIIYSDLVYAKEKYAIDFADKFNISMEERKIIINKNLLDVLDRGQYENFLEFKEALNLPEVDFELICKEGLLQSFEKGNIQSTLGMLESLRLPKTIIHSEEIDAVAKVAIKKYLTDYLSSNMSHHAMGIYGDLIKFDAKFQLTENDYCDVAKEIFKKTDNSFSVMLGMHEVSKLPESIIQNPELRLIIADKIINTLKETQQDGETILFTGDVADIKKLFKITYTNIEIYSNFPGIEKIVNSIIEINPNLLTNFENDDFLLQFVPYAKNTDYFSDILQKSPFLLQALIENKQHGSKLLLKYPEFDNDAKQNITTLYSNKKEIQKKHTDIDPNSSEFRIFMQKELAKFGRNEIILAEIKKSGVNVKQWLEYIEEQHFDLGVEDDVPFSKQIQSPIKRIDQSIGNYINQIATTLGQYKKDLISKESMSDKKPELEAKLAKMREQLIVSKLSGDEARSQGIQKGVTSLEKQIEQLKPDNLWNKISGEIERLKSSTEHLSKLFQELCLLEEGIKTIGDDKKLQVAQKDKIKKQEQKIKEKIIDFDKSLTGFQNNFNSILKQAFSTGRADSISQEITMSIGEDFDHYRTDFSTIQSLFKEDSSPLEKTPMRIGIAPRNPDVDLYLGNYAPCCICIDSEYHGGQSPIADYATDLGMHNIVVYDEQRKKPVAVAWCFIGKNNNGNEPILVIDNIEANTDYSIKFKSQLEKKLGEYITKFAKASKISKIIQGQLNNDLEVAELSEIDKKLGGTNRATGYYLEAERDVDENDAEDWEEDYYEDENDDMPTEHVDELQQENVEQDEKYNEYENERGDFLRSNRARRTLRENK